MLFSSLTFLFCFLPVTVGLYYLVRRELRNIVLLLASIFFYAWGEPRYLPVIFTTITISYIGALALGKFKYKKLLLTLFILLDLSLLFYFKYTNFFLENLNLIFHKQWSLKVVLPLGISFYTFQALSYLVDVYRGQVKAQKNYLKIALYICLFPQLIAGPIVKYHDISDQIDNRKETVDKVYYGIRRFIIGLAKKVLIANTLGGVADKVFAQSPSEFGAGIAWLGAVSYALQLYYDFSGYSDMAIGLGSIFGFKFLENFNYPLVSKSITEFWTRWHISLSTWIRDYLYIPLGGSRVSTGRKYFNLIFVMLIIGLWHGASWNFIIWGLWWGIFVILEKILQLKEKRRNIFTLFVSILYVNFVCALNAPIFNCKNLMQTWLYIQSMFNIVTVKDINYGILYYLDRITLVCFVVSVLCATSLFKNILSWGKKWKIISAVVDIWLFILLFFSCMQLAATTYNPFIYFRF